MSHGIHHSLITRWKKEYRDDPENAFSGKGNIYKEDARLGELERVIGQLYAENSFFNSASIYVRISIKFTSHPDRIFSAS